MNQYRTHNCNELNINHQGQVVTLSGWIKSIRDHSGVLFIDLRDHYGITQIVIRNKDLLDQIDQIRIESVITVIGTVELRSKETINTNINTGAIEIKSNTIHILSKAKVLPFPINGTVKIPEELGLKYRYLSLRDDILHNNLILRHKVLQKVREILVENDFLEIHTPILTKSSPEGARDFIVPSRLHHGKFYALPQAPQQFKQLLMISRFDKYFQIAPCFRDEDSRADRSPGEFYQIDMEMAFATQEDVFSIVETLLTKIFKEYGTKPIKPEIKRIPYIESMLKYGSDKPDLRNPIIIEDITEFCNNITHEILNKLIQNGAKVRILPIKNVATETKSFFDKLQDFAKKNGAPQGIAYIIKKNNEFKGPLVKFLDNVDQIWSHLNLNNNDGIFFVIDQAPEKLSSLLRKYLGEELNLIDTSHHILCWITDFPFYELTDDNKIDFTHNPFSMIQGGMDALDKCQGKTEELLKLKSYQYDIVCDGIELSSGAVRNHIPELMYKVFKYTGKDDDYINENFGGMIKAMEYSAPPHAGIAPGFDRLIMLLTNEINIRQVIAFPLNQNAEDMMLNAPAHITKEQLQELSIAIIDKKPIKQT